MSLLSDDEIGNYYMAFMEVLKDRLFAVGTTLQSIPSGGSNDKPRVFLDIEFCFLQMRFIIEHIAVAVLIAQNKDPRFRTKDISKAWNADKIFGYLENLSPERFPKSLVRTVGTDNHMSFTDRQDSYLSLGKIRKIYNDCSLNLHTGSLRQVRAGRKIVDIKPLGEWCTSIHHLLEHHSVDLINGEKLIVTMAEPSLGNRVHAFFVKPQHKR